MKLTGVGFVLSVGHNSPEGVAHGHSYDVTVWYRFGHDARALQRHANAVKQTLCHTVLPDELQLAENLAEHIAGELPGCVAVDCNRPLERIFARWEAANFSVDERMITMRDEIRANLAPHHPAPKR